MNKFLGYVSLLVRVLCGTMVAALLLINFAAVIMRYVFSSPIFWCEEVSLILFAWCIALAMIPLTYQRSGVSLDYFVDMMPEKGREILKIIVDILGVTLLVVVAVFGMDLMRRSMYRVTPILQISYRYIYLSMVIGMGVSAFILLSQAVEDAIKLIRRMRRI